MKNLINASLYFLILNSTVLLANEEAHHTPGISDLKYPLINFIILVAILSKVIKPLREKFNKQADDVKSLVDSAARNHKDAEEKLAQYNDKMKHLDSELIKINNEYESDAIEFAKIQSEETQTMISRMKRDLESKLEGERKELIEEMNHELLEKVLKQAQTTIGSSGDYKNKATNKIISELR